jgi:hypothetical protein
MRLQGFCSQLLLSRPHAHTASSGGGVRVRRYPAGGTLHARRLEAATVLALLAVWRSAKTAGARHGYLAAVVLSAVGMIGNDSRRTRQSIAGPDSSCPASQSNWDCFRSGSGFRYWRSPSRRRSVGW